MCHAFLSDPNFYDLLFRLDEDLAGEVRGAGCACGGVLHSARYPRKPRGMRTALGEAYETRLSFCCAREGCRRRITPASVRFLGRRVYLGAVVVLATALCHGPSRVRFAQLHAWFGVSLRTLTRWRKWWREVFVRTPFWRTAKGRFVPPLQTRALPAGLLERFAGTERPTPLVGLLRFLSPLTVSLRTLREAQA